MEPSWGRSGSLSRAAAGGLLAGTLGGALYLGALALRRAGGPDCASLTAQECALEQRVNAALMRWQGLGALALALLGVALALWLKGGRRPAEAKGRP